MIRLPWILVALTFLLLAGCSRPAARVQDLAEERLGQQPDWGRMSLEITYLKESTGTDYVRTTVSAGDGDFQTLADVLLTAQAIEDEETPALSPELTADGSLCLLDGAGENVFFFYWIASPGYLVLVEESQGENGPRRDYRFYTLPPGLPEQLAALRPAPTPTPAPVVPEDTMLPEDTPAPGSTP